jgi:hypothetical protein
VVHRYAVVPADVFQLGRPVLGSPLRVEVAQRTNLKVIALRYLDAAKSFEEWKVEPLDTLLGFLLEISQPRLLRLPV